MSKYEELSKLKELLDAGVLSKEEFEAEKKKILDVSEEVKPSPATSTKKPGFFSKEAIRQRQEAFDKLPKAEQQAKQGAVIGFGIVFIMFTFLILFFAMMFGCSGVKAALENLWGR